jgi:hypothetical protein
MGRIVARLDIRLSGKIGFKHGEIISDDRVEFVLLPIRSGLATVSHSFSLPKEFV